MDPTLTVEMEVRYEQDEEARRGGRRKKKEQGKKQYGIWMMPFYKLLHHGSKLMNTLLENGDSWFHSGR